MGLDEKMNVIILAAGYGTRLHPLTKNSPKALLDIGGKPLLDHLIQNLEQIDTLKKVYVVSNDKFYDQFNVWKDQQGSSLDIEILNNGTTSNETRLGAIGDIDFALKTAGIDNDTLILASDTIFEINMNDMVKLFKEKYSSIVGSEYQPDRERLKACSVIESDEAGKIISFEEKPSEPKGTTGGVPIYLLKKELLKHVPIVLETSSDYMGGLIQYMVSQGEVFHTFNIPKRHHFTTIEDYNKLNKELSS